MTQVKLTLEEWEEQFKPLRNHMADPVAHERPNNHTMFETYTMEVIHVYDTFEKSPLNVWTLLDCDGVQVIANGLHYVNRMGYFITEVPAIEGTDYEIIYDDPTEEEELKQFQITTRVTETTTYRITVEARDEEDARDQIDDLLDRGFSDWKIIHSESSDMEHGVQEIT